MGAIDLDYQGGIADGGEDQLIGTLWDVQAKITFGAGGGAAGGVVEEYADAGQWGAAGGVRDDARQDVTRLLREQARSCEDKDG